MVPFSRQREDKASCPYRLTPTLASQQKHGPHEFDIIHISNMPSSSSSSKAKKLPSGWTAEQDEAYQARKKAEAKAAAEAKEQEKVDKAHAAELKKRYQGRADPTTVEDWVDPDALQEEFFKEGEWKASWVQVEFVSSLHTTNREHTGSNKPAPGRWRHSGSKKQVYRATYCGTG